MKFKCKKIVRDASIHCDDCYKEDAKHHIDLYAGIDHCDGCLAPGKKKETND